MFRLLFPVLLSVLTALAAPVAAQTEIRLSAPFDPGQLSRGELRTLQAALAFEGSYDALLDGAWGAGSQLALRNWMRDSASGARPTWRDVRALLRRWEAERQANGWRPVWHEADRVFHLRPDALLRQSAEGDETRFVSPDGGLAIVIRRGGLRPTDLHEAFVADARRGTQPYRLREDDLIVTSAEMRGGRHVYARSDRERGIWMTHILLSDDANRGRLGLIASSFQRSPGGDVDPTGGRALSSLLDGAGRPLPEAETPRGSASGDPLERLLTGALEAALDEIRREDAAPAPEPVPTRPEQGLAASGFYVNTTDIVTSAALPARCDGVRIARGPELTLLTVDPARGIAVFEGPGPVRGFLTMSTDPAEEDGTLTAVSRRPQDDGVQTYRGRIVDLREGGFLTHDLGVPRRGELGAPLVTANGTVRGVWLDEDGRSAPTPGTGRLARTLREARVPFLRGTVGSDETERMADAVVSLVCAR